MNNTHAVPNGAEVRQNEFLAALSAETIGRFSGHLALVDLPMGAVLDQTEDAEGYAYFPNDTLISLLSMIENGKSVEIGVIGREGFVGIEGVTGCRNPYIQAKVQCAGTAFRLPKRLLRNEFNQYLDTRKRILRFMQSMIVQVGQAAICFRHHSIEQQLCRKLLASSDRLCSDELALTQSMIADHLGVRREGVTAVAGELRRQGFIHYRRGHVTIRNRAELEKRCCECRAVLQAHAHQVPGGEPRSNTLNPGLVASWARPTSLAASRYEGPGDAAA